MRLAVDTEPGRGVLHVIHDHGGGTETHVRALIAGSREHWRHYLAIAVGDRWQVEEHRADGGVVTFDLERGAHGVVGRIRRRHLRVVRHRAHPPAQHFRLSRRNSDARCDALPVPYGYTVHDLNFACPTITFLAADGMYCGAQTDAAVCSRCLAAQPAFDRVDIGAMARSAITALLRRAAFRIAPSQWAADTLQRYFPDCPATVIAHGSPRRAGAAPARCARTTRAARTTMIPTVAVLGAIGPDKGRAPSRAAGRNWRARRARPCASSSSAIWTSSVVPGSPTTRVFTVHGRYEPADLPDLLAHYRVALVLYPSAGPETFSYTLTEAWARRPAGAGAADRSARANVSRDSGAGWIMTDAQWRDEAQMLDRLCALLRAHRSAIRIAAASTRARALPHAALDADDAGNFRSVRDAMANAQATARPVDAVRSSLRACVTRCVMCRGSSGRAARRCVACKLSRPAGARGRQSPQHARRTRALPVDADGRRRRAARAPQVMAANAFADWLAARTRPPERSPAGRRDSVLPPCRARRSALAGAAFPPGRSAVAAGVDDRCAASLAHGGRPRSNLPRAAARAGGGRDDALAISRARAWSRARRSLLAPQDARARATSIAASAAAGDRGDALVAAALFAADPALAHVPSLAAALAAVSAERTSATRLLKAIAPHAATLPAVTRRRAGGKRRRDSGFGRGAPLDACRR